MGRWLFDLFGEEFPAEFPTIGPRYNVSPTQSILIARRPPTESRIQLEFARWGLVPSWAKEPRSSAPLINARAETLAEKPSFRQAFASGRCAVIADGYYEWQVLDKNRKQPFWIYRADEAPFLMAAVSAVNHHVDPKASMLSATIVTTCSNESLSIFHDRMPVILDTAEKTQRWLSNDATIQDQRLADLSPAPNDYFQTRRVSSWVGNPRHEDARCLEPQPILWQRTLGIDEPVEPDI